MKIQKGMLSLCTKVGRFNNSKAELMQTVSVKIQKKAYAGGRFNNFKTILMQVIDVKIQKEKYYWHFFL